MEWPDDSLPHDLAGYHKRTKHAPNRYALGPAFLDWSSQPNPFRRFVGARLVELPLGYDRRTPPFDELGDAPAQALDIGSLGLFGAWAWPECVEGGRWRPLGGAEQPVERQPASDRRLSGFASIGWHREDCGPLALCRG